MRKGLISDCARIGFKKYDYWLENVGKAQLDARGGSSGSDTITSEGRVSGGKKASSHAKDRKMEWK